MFHRIKNHIKNNRRTLGKSFTDDDMCLIIFAGCAVWTLPFLSYSLYVTFS